MRRDHVTVELLRSIGAGEVPLAELFVRVYEHLRAVCPECAQAVESYAEEMEARVLAERYDPLPEDRLNGLRQTLHCHQEKLDALEGDVPGMVEELLGMPEDRALREVRRGEVKRCNPLVVDRLLAECRRQVSKDAKQAEVLARLAKEVTLYMPVDEFGVELANDLLLRCQINRANALRAGRDLKQADELVNRALIDRATSSDPLIHGEILRVASSLRRTQNRLPEALAHSNEALSLYREVGDSHLQGKTLMGRALLHQAMHQEEKALRDLQRASALIDSKREPFLELCIHHNLAWYLCDIDRFGEAEARVRANRSLYERFPSPVLALRRRCLEARIARGLGRLDEAEALFLEVREGFLEQGMVKDATLISLDLALLLAEAGRSTELKELASEMVTLCQAQGIQSEAVASLMLFQQAAAAEAVTLGLIRDLSAHLGAMFNGLEKGLDQRV